MTAGCASARHCVAYDRNTRLPAGTVTAPLCPGCLNRAAADIRALPADHRRLAADLVPPGRGPGEHTSGGDPEARAPIVLAVDELRRGIAWALSVWEPPVREAAGLSRERTGRTRDTWAVHAASRLLAAEIVAFARLGPTWGYAEGLDAGPVLHDGVAGITALRSLHLAAARAVGAVSLTRSAPGLCPGCGAPALSRVDGSDLVSCGVCGNGQTFDDYRRYVGLILDGAP